MEKLNVHEQIKEYIASQPEPKRSEIQALHDSILQISPGCKLWFLDGKDDKGKVVSNPNIGFGNYTMRLAAGKTREFYQVGLTANATGISVYIMGIEDKKYLSETYGKDLGGVTGIASGSRALKDINTDVLKAAVAFGFENTNEK